MLVHAEAPLFEETQMAPRLTRLTNSDPAFYATLGPFLARREVHKALGGVPWDEDTKTWFVLADHEGVVAFGAVTQGARRTLLESLYIARPDAAPDAATRLITAAVEAFGHDRDLHTKIRNEHVPAYQAVGFHPVKPETNFTALVRPASIRKNP
ncbi:MAG TPA: hypothetical protein DD420_35005 [Streptomyces sp.]|nr:hypothetical protein [Streptomyces sp.]